MPSKTEDSTQYTAGGTPSNRGMLRRLSPMFFLTICSILCIVTVIAALIVFTFLPIFTTAKGDQTKYQVRSDILTLVYNLPDRLSMSSMNWTYEPNDLEADKLSILQNLLQDQLNNKKITKKTSLTIMNAFITRQPSSINITFVSPVTFDSHNNPIIIITQPDNDTEINSTSQLIVSLRLRYALECAKKCQNNMKESIFAKTFHSLELPIDTFQKLFTNNLKTSTNQFLSSSSRSTNAPPPPTPTTATARPCIVNTYPYDPASSVITAMNYEAESLLNTFISTTTELCSACSGEKKVSNIGFTNELIFQQILSYYGGSTIVIFYYITDRIRSAEIVINDMSPSINVTFPVMSTNQTISSTPVILNLCQGFNSIRIYNRDDYTPDIDRIIVY
ncbi:unnamed protein product [Adineta steineri]|uniref:Uncharacterized protein n=1 Tax=Adineta steineri TaxID=433720 RepID=A0A815GR29_9BILA|nr:unnamed protein product [Adineta steineri]CAF1593297.1 unnamed protein product [Adineta steineri]